MKDDRKELITKENVNPLVMHAIKLIGENKSTIARKIGKTSMVLSQIEKILLNINRI